MADSKKSSFGPLLVGLAAVSGILAPASAQAFCGFFVTGARAEIYNNASQVALLRNGSHTVLAMSNNYKGPPEDFAMVVPVPVVLQKEQVKTLPIEVFRHLDYLSAPRLVEYWEQDPCYKGFPEPKAEQAPKDGALRSKVLGVLRKDDLGVKIEAQFIVGEYEVLILSAKESGGLETWLRQRHYNIPQGAAAALAPYIRDQMKFFVAKVDIKKVRRDVHGLVVLSPLRFSYDASELRLPVRLGLLNAETPSSTSSDGKSAGGSQDLLIYVLHPQKRFEVANYPNVFIPTNLLVDNAVRDRFGAFYAALFDETRRKSDPRAVVTEYAWGTGSCDPCPTPPLDRSELSVLGWDADRFGPQGLVLTRLHTRYDRNTLSADLIFREVPPVMGGRGGAEDGPYEAEMRGASVDNFQGRYIIRHYWQGPITCAKPHYGAWGASSQGSNASEPTVAKDLANTPRGTVSLLDLVHSQLPLLGLPGKAQPRR